MKGQSGKVTEWQKKIGLIGLALAGPIEEETI
jgi:hypothetical protein